MKAILTLIRSERKRTGRVPRALQIKAAELSLKNKNYVLAMDLLRYGLRDVGYESGLEARGMAALPYHVLLLRLHLARMEVRPFNS